MLKSKKNMGRTKSRAAKPAREIKAKKSKEDIRIDRRDDGVYVAWYQGNVQIAAEGDTKKEAETRLRKLLDLKKETREALHRDAEYGGPEE